MKGVELYGRVRHAVRIEGLSERAAARRFGLDPRTVNKMMKFSVPPGYVRKKPPAKPKLDAFIPMIDRILGDDKSRPKKQQHTAKRIFERLRDEHGFTGGITIVKDYVAGWRQRAQEMFVPLVHPPGHAQADFGEAIGIIGGVERKIHFSLLTCRTRMPASWSAIRQRRRKPSATATFERLPCTWKNAPVTLTVTEFLILQALASRPGVVKSRNALMDADHLHDSVTQPQFQHVAPAQEDEVTPLRPGRAAGRNSGSEVDSQGGGPGPG